VDAIEIIAREQRMGPADRGIAGMVSADDLLLRAPTIIVDVL